MMTSMAEFRGVQDFRAHCLENHHSLLDVSSAVPVAPSSESPGKQMAATMDFFKKRLDCLVEGPVAPPSAIPSAPSPVPAARTLFPVSINSSTRRTRIIVSIFAPNSFYNFCPIGVYHPKRPSKPWIIR
jgi:hypothetical protein